MDEKVVKELKENFKNVNEWLKFAELKNGMIVVFNGTCISFVVANNISDGIWKKGIISLFAISLIISILSFWSRMMGHSYVAKKKGKIRSNKRNLLYYKDIYDILPQDYLREMYMYYFDKKVTELNKLELDYAEEIVINSRIASNKYVMFNFALILSVLGVISIVFS